MTLEDRITALEQKIDDLFRRIDRTKINGQPLSEILFGEGAAPYTHIVTFQPGEVVSPLRKQYNCEARETELLEQRVDRVTEHPESTVKWRDVRRTYTREQVVEMAKKDVEDKLRAYRSYHSMVNLEFVVNRQKRTVVALKRSQFSGKVLDRAVAKCAPNDCFNIHIGKAIAANRLDGKVPDYYVNAPQPTEARVGDVIRFDDDEDDFVVVARLTDKTPFQYATNVIGKLNGFIVVDDSHDFGGEQL